MSGELSDGVATVVVGFDEPEKWAVVRVFDGEVLDTRHDLLPSRPAVRARAAELRELYPSHTIRVLRRTVVWTEEGQAES
jgi:hypothetical protein